MSAPPRWTPSQLAAGRERAIALFRRERLEEPVDSYAVAFDRYQGVVEDVLEATVDLSDLKDATMSGVLRDADQLLAFRYFSGPPISEDDLKTLVEKNSLAPKHFASDYGLVKRVTETVVSCLDKRRFPWVAVPRRNPEEAERTAAVLASAALMAYQHIQKTRRHQGKTAQEEMVEQALLGMNFILVKRRKVQNLTDAPEKGEFCRESVLGTRKADFIVSARNGLKLAIECKVSNSALNSVKRLNNDAAAKAETWIKDFGPRNVVPIAVLSGVYDLASLEEAQSRGLTLFWAHLLPDFCQWVQSLR